MAKIIPGVQVTVIKEVVPPQLAPSGVLGLIGLAAPPRIGQDGLPISRKPIERIGSWGRFRDLYGRATAWAMPEAQQALQNGVFELVVIEVSSQVANSASGSLAVANNDWLELRFRAPGTAGNGLAIRLVGKPFQGRVQSYELTLSRGTEVIETHRNISPVVGSARWLGAVLAASDSLLDITPPSYQLSAYSNPEVLTNVNDHTTVASFGGEPVLVVRKIAAGEVVSFSVSQDALQVTRGGDTLFSLATGDPALLGQLADRLAREPDLAVEYPALEVSAELAGGLDASESEYIEALGELVNVDDVDLVIASVQELTTERAAMIYGAVIAHCDQMSADAKGRLGLGQVPPDNDADDNVDLAGTLVSDRFSLFAPHGVLGAATGRIGSLEYYQSPTFKSVAGLGVLEPNLRIETQRAYLKANLVPVAELPGRGNVIIRGLTTDGDQINVRRIADRAVRGVRQIGELFIGKLNTESGRNALKQKLNEFLLQMTRDNALVPSTDGSDPAFKLDVYSTQADFALGIVRVDLAIRPVRAIDYIYATVLVQV